MIIRVGVLSVFLAVAQSSPSIGESNTQSPRQAYDRQMRLLEQVFESHSQDQTRLRSLYTRDAVLVEADGNEIHGRDHIVPAFQKVLASGVVAHFHVTTTTFRSNGNLSYAGGTEEIDERVGSGMRHARNRFVLVMKHEADGQSRLDYVLEART